MTRYWNLSILTAKYMICRDRSWVSALRAQNLDTVLDMIFKYLPYGPQFYDEDTITDQPERAIVAEIIREKALHALDDEILHGIAVVH